MQNLLIVGLYEIRSSHLLKSPLTSCIGEGGIRIGFSATGSSGKMAFRLNSMAFVQLVCLRPRLGVLYKFHRSSWHAYIGRTLHYNTLGKIQDICHRATAVPCIRTHSHPRTLGHTRPRTHAHACRHPRTHARTLSPCIHPRTHARCLPSSTHTRTHAG